METLKTISGRKFKITSNVSLRHYTIKTDSGKYRTFKLSKYEFNSYSYYTGNDWQNFLNTNYYYKL